MKKSGFTLAEVLITLGIIGVVAAMTIPSLITSYKAYRYRTQFLKNQGQKYSKQERRKYKEKLKINQKRKEKKEHNKMVI